MHNTHIYAEKQLNALEYERRVLNHKTREIRALACYGSRICEKMQEQGNGMETGFVESAIYALMDEVMGIRIPRRIQSVDKPMDDPGMM